MKSVSKSLVATALVGTLMLNASCGGKGADAANLADSTSEDTTALCVLPAKYNAYESDLLKDYRQSTDMYGRGVKAVLIPRGMMDTISVDGVKPIYRYYVNGGTVLFLEPRSRDWLYFWRKMQQCREDKAIKVSEAANEDLNNWALELLEVASYSGREEMFEPTIGFAIGVRVNDYYSQSDSLDVNSLRRWLAGVPTDTLFREAYERSQKR